jgi:hypothetical protein
MHLLDLPAEIRLKIYSELLVLEESIPLISEYGTPAASGASAAKG